MELDLHFYHRAESKDEIWRFRANVHKHTKQHPLRLGMRPITRELEERLPPELRIALVDINKCTSCAWLFEAKAEVADSKLAEAVLGIGCTA